jgi:uncharacterized protein (DUF58 family)
MGITWIILICGFIVAIQSFILGGWALSRVSYTRQFNKPTCYVGEVVEIVEVITNSKPLPVIWLRMESTIDASLQFHGDTGIDIHEGERSQHHKSLFTLFPYRRIRRRHEVVCVKRGIYRLESVVMTAGDLLGLRTRSRRITLQADLVVYPSIIPMQDVPLPSHNWQGDISVRRWIVDDPFIISGVREYRAGDGMNQISWKATARTGKLQVFQRDFTSDHRLVVLLNIEVSEGMWDVVTDEALIERGISYAATIITNTIAQGMTAGFAHNAHSREKSVETIRIPSQGGSEHLLTILDAMSRIEMKKKLAFHSLLEEEIVNNSEKNDYVIITSHVTEIMSNLIDRLRTMGHSVQILSLEKDELERRETAV